MLIRIAKITSAGALCALLAVACHTSTEQAAPNAAEEKQIAEVTVGDVEHFVKDKAATILDANDSDTPASSDTPDPPAAGRNA